MKAQTLGEFYDKRGLAALKSGSDYGSTAIDLHLREPYLFVESILRELALASPNARMLDLCCGTGIHSILPAKLNLEVTGVDISPLSIEAAQQLTRKHGVESRCVFHCSDVETLAQSQPNSFDIVFVSGAVYYFDLEMLLNVVNRILRPGGIFICIETYGGNWMMNAIRRAKNVILKHRDQQSLSRLLNIQSIRHLQAEFPEHQVRFFDFCTLFGVFIRRMKGPRQSFHKIAATADDFLLNRLLFRGLAFKFVFWGRKRA